LLDSLFEQLAGRLLENSLNIFLGSSQSSTYPSGEKLPGSSGRVGENCHASGCDSPAASLDGLFEQPVFIYALRHEVDSEPEGRQTITPHYFFTVSVMRIGSSGSPQSSRL